MPTTQGLEYNFNALGTLLQGSNTIGLVFEKQSSGFNHLAPFDISPLYFDTSTFAFGKGASIRLPVSKRWMDAGPDLQPDNANVLPAAGDLFDYNDLEYFHNSFELCIFFREELETMIGTGNNIVISGMELNFGMLTTMNSKQYPPTFDPAHVFTLKAETTFVSPWPPSAFSAADNIGAASVVPGLPCPPYWVSAVGSNLMTVVYKRLIMNIREMDGDVAKLLITGELENRIRRSWVEFLLRNGKQRSKDEVKDKDKDKDKLADKKKQFLEDKDIFAKDSKVKQGSNSDTNVKPPMSKVDKK